MTARLGFLARHPQVPAAVASIKRWAREALGLDDETALSVNELACALPDCPPRETVILILRAGAPAMRISIHKAIVDIGEPDIRQACAAGGELLEAKTQQERD